MPKGTLWPPGEPPPPPPGGLVALINPDPPVWLYSIDLPTSPPTKLRLAAYHERVFFGRDSTGAEVAYSPGSIGHDREQLDSEGGLPSVRLFAQNVSREGIALFEEFGGLSGQRVRITCMLLSETPDGNPIRDDYYEVLDSSATESAIEMRLGRAALKEKQMPDRRISRLYCGHHFGGTGCGYDTTAPGALQTCSKTEDGPLGCKAHGDAEVLAAGGNEDARQHPARILAFKGVARTSGVGVG